MPSLIPLVFALIIYFATFNTAISIFDEKNTAFAKEMESLKIARIMRSNGYIVDLENFGELCSSVNPNYTKFVAGVAELGRDAETATSPEEPYDFYLEYYLPLKEQFLNYGGNNAQCFEAGKSAVELEDKFFCCSNAIESFDEETLESRQVSQKIYPIVLEKDRGNGLGIVVSPMQLVVVSWN